MKASRAVVQTVTLGLAEQFELIVETAGRVALPLEVRAALGLEPGDLFSIVKNPVSLRLDSHRELAADWRASSLPDLWREEFLRRPQTAVDAEGTLPISPDLLLLPEGGRIVLEVVTRGLSHDLFIYRVAG